MDMEKYTSGKVYLFFEWAFKLIVWNLLTLLIVSIISIVPTYLFIRTTSNYDIEQVNKIGNQVEVLLKSGEKHIVGSFPENYEIKNIRVETDYIYLDVDDIVLAIANDEKYYELDAEKTYFNEDKELILYGMKKETNVGKVFEKNINVELSGIDINSNMVIALDNNVRISFGEAVKVNNTLSFILLFIAILLALFAFIPCFVTNFSMIKIFSEDGSTNTISLYFDRLLDNFKSLYKLELIIIPYLSLLCFGLYYYFMIINRVNDNSFLNTVSYSIILITIIIFLLWLVSLPMTLGYFRMRPYTIFKFTLVMAFKNILFTVIYLVLLFIPLLLALINGFFLPIWFLVGFTLPQLITYLLSVKKYRYIVHNLDSYKEDDIYDLKENNK